MLLRKYLFGLFSFFTPEYLFSWPNDFVSFIFIFSSWIAFKVMEVLYTSISHRHGPNTF